MKQQLKSEQAYQHIRKYIEDTYANYIKRHTPGAQYAARMSEKDGALKWLQVLRDAAMTQAQSEQSSLLGE